MRTSFRIAQRIAYAIGGAGIGLMVVGFADSYTYLDAAGLPAFFAFMAWQLSRIRSSPWG